MSLNNQPLVSIVTPFYNTEEFLAECIESVLSQTYTNWEYILINNCSTDRSFEIAFSYAQREPRIRLINNEVFLSQVQNYNHSLRMISPESKYCKIVQADDWIFPDCITEMVNLAEAHPTTGIVCSYWLRDKNVMGKSIPYPNTLITGSDICKQQLLNHPDQHFFATATALLIRACIIRNRDSFYDENISYFEDYEVWFKVLKNYDYGFVHKVLTFQRVDHRSISGRINNFFPNLAVAFICLKKYGRTYLSCDEYEMRMQTISDRYFHSLARGIILYSYRRQLWTYHLEMLKSNGYNIDVREFARALLWEIRDILRHPKLLFRTMLGLVNRTKHK